MKLGVIVLAVICLAAAGCQTRGETVRPLTLLGEGSDFEDLSSFRKLLALEPGTEAYERAKAIITENMDALERLANALLEHEVLDGEEIDTVIRGEDLPIREPENRRSSAQPVSEEDEGEVKEPVDAPSEAN